MFCKMMHEKQGLEVEASKAPEFCIFKKISSIIVVFAWCYIYRGMYPCRPDECRGEQRGKVEQQTQGAVHVSSHDEEHCRSQPVVARVTILLSDWRAEGVKEPKIQETSSNSQ